MRIREKVDNTIFSSPVGLFGASESKMLRDEARSLLANLSPVKKAQIKESQAAIVPTSNTRDIVMQFGKRARHDSFRDRGT